MGASTRGGSIRIVPNTNGFIFPMVYLPASINSRNNTDGDRTELSVLTSHPSIRIPFSISGNVADMVNSRNGLGNAAPGYEKAFRSH